MADKRKIPFNPDEPSVGNFAPEEYKKYHPIHGNAADIAYMRGEMRGLRNHDIRLTIISTRVDAETGEESRPHRHSERLRYNNYNDVFSTGGIIASFMHSQLEINSDDQLNFIGIEIEDYG